MDYGQMSGYKRLAEGALAPMKRWSKQCHAASVRLVESGVIPGARVARGTCRMVPGQHSWVCIGDPYADNVLILDPTLWSYTGVAAEVWVGERKRFNHRPFGYGNIFAWGRPPNCKLKQAVSLPEPEGGWTSAAKTFLEMLGPIDMDGWRILAHAPVQGWPATEIMTQMCRHSESMRMMIPVDIRGMVCNEVTELYPKCPT